VLGVPSWITDDQVVSYLGAGLIARTLVRHAQGGGCPRLLARGDEVRVVSSDPLVAEVTAAWARSLGARIVNRTADLVIRDEVRARREGRGSHGRLAQAAVDVFQAIRAGVFDSVGMLPQSQGRIAA
jgi:NADPH2:quinone reductase